MNEKKNPSIRQSPLQAVIAELTLYDGPDEPSVGLCDLSLLEKWGLKGKGGANWLAEMGIEVPATIYESRRLPEGGLIVRVGRDEFFIEAGRTDQSLAPLRDAVPERADCMAVVREDAALLISGSRSPELFAQTCGHPLADSPLDRIVFTRVAGVSCGILPQSQGGQTHYRLWCDPSYAIYLWETLLEITRELDGGVTRGSL